MSFPVNLFLDLDNHRLTVSDNPEGSPLPSEIFIEILKDHLTLIMSAAKKRCSVQNLSSLLKAYLKGSKEGKLIKEDCFRAGFSGISTMLKLVEFLEKYGKEQFPKLFKGIKSQGLKAITKAHQTLIEILQKESASQALKELSSQSEKSSRKRKAVKPERKASAKKRVIESSSGTIPSSSESLLEPLEGRPVHLFDSEAYQGPDSEGEEVEKDLEVRKAAEALLCLQQSSQMHVESIVPRPASKISQEKVSKDINNYPLFIIDTLHRSRLNIFTISYTTRWCSQNSYRVKIRVRKNFITNRRHLLKILELEEKADIKWKNPFCETEKSTSIDDRATALVQIFQGLKATFDYYEINHPDVFHGVSGFEAKKALTDSMKILKSYLKKFSNISLKGVLKRPVSVASPYTPSQVLTRLVEKKKEQLAIQHIQPVVSKYSAPSCFTYLFAIHKSGGTPLVPFFNIKYSALTSSSGFSDLISKCRRSIKNTLKYLNIVIGSSYDQLRYTDPKTGLLSDIQTHNQLLKIILNGLEENYYYIYKHTGRVFDNGTQQELAQQYYQTLLSVRKTYSKTTGLTVEELEAKEDYNILENLVGLKELEKGISLANVLKKEFSTTFVLEPYIFSIQPISGFMQGYYLSYTKKRYGFKQDVYMQSKVAVTETIRQVRKFLESEPFNTIFQDPYTLFGQRVTEEAGLWSTILQGLMEMNLFYKEHLPKLFHSGTKPTIGDELESLIKEILQKKEKLCGPLITKAVIIPSLVKKQSFLEEPSSSSLNVHT